MSEGITFINRYTGEAEIEKVYGERWLRLIYENPVGRLALHALIKRAFVSRAYGARMDKPSSARLIADFIENYAIDTAEFLDPVESFSTFNEFFYRRLKPGARPIDQDPAHVVFPADGRHFGFPDLAQAQPEYVKHVAFDLPGFLADRDLAHRYENGTMIVSRLCPVDYHRFHFPVAGVASEPRLIDGLFHSVSPIALSRMPRVYLDNRRWLTEIDSERFGKVVMLEVAATNVGAVDYTSGFGAINKGDEKGCFKFGGSSTVLVFERGRVVLADDLVARTREGIELYARVGDLAGHAPDAHE